MKARLKRGTAIFAAAVLAPLISQTIIQSPVFLASALAVDPACVPASDTVTIPGYTVLTFSTIGTCSWTAPTGVTTLESLVVVGGGGGGAGVYTGDNFGAGGGGGGGGVYSATSVSIPSSVTIQIGGGGNGGGFSSSRGGNTGARGSTSAFGTITAGGGGGGGCDGSCATTAVTGGNGTAAGSGGGSSNYYNAYDAGVAGTASSATFNGTVFASQVGFAGGNYNQGGSSIGGAGGPGGGARGAANFNTRGIGLASNITGSNVEYGRGGGVYGVTGWTFASSTPGYGTGGDGRHNSNAVGANGARGVVIVKIKNATSITTSIAAGNLSYRTIKIITATPNLSGKLTFRANNRIIPGCKNLAALANIGKTCSYKPSKRGDVTITVTLIPTDVGFSSRTTEVGSYFISARSGGR